MYNWALGAVQCMAMSTVAISYDMEDKGPGKIEVRAGTLLCLLDLDSSTGVADLDVELRGTIQNGNALPRADVVGNLGAENAVLHEKDVELVGVVDEILVKAVWQEVARLAV